MSASLVIKAVKAAVSTFAALMIIAAKLRGGRARPRKIFKEETP
jgi:hypothetical protein